MSMKTLLFTILTVHNERYGMYSYIFLETRLTKLHCTPSKTMEYELHVCVLQNRKRTTTSSTDQSCDDAYTTPSHYSGGGFKKEVTSLYRCIDRQMYSIILVHDHIFHIWIFFCFFVCLMLFFLIVFSSVSWLVVLLLLW